MYTELHETEICFNELDDNENTALQAKRCMAVRHHCLRRLDLEKLFRKKAMDAKADRNIDVEHVRKRSLGMTKMVPGEWTQRKSGTRL